MKRLHFYGKHILILAAFYYVLVALITIAVFGIKISKLKQENRRDLALYDNEETRLGSTMVSGSVESGEADSDIAPKEPLEEEYESGETEEYDIEDTEETPDVPRFYSFITTNTDTILHVRKEPDINAKVIDRLKPGTEGYIVERYDDWSYVYVPSKNRTGYCSNEYLELHEITEEEYSEAVEDMDGNGEEADEDETDADDVSFDPDGLNTDAVPAIPIGDFFAEPGDI